MTISSIVEWFKVAKPEPNIKDLSMQLGVHYEEVAEILGTTVAAVKSLTSRARTTLKEKLARFFEQDD